MDVWYFILGVIIGFILGEFSKWLDKKRREVK
jgi:hypothetical protein